MSNKKEIAFTTTLEEAFELGIFNPYDFDLDDIPTKEELQKEYLSNENED